jgi:hypothetical protein
LAWRGKKHKSTPSLPYKQDERGVVHPIFSPPLPVSQEPEDLLDYEAAEGAQEKPTGAAEGDAKDSKK